MPTLPNDSHQTERLAEPRTTLILKTLGTAGLYSVPGNALVLGAGKPLATLLVLAFAPARRASRESLIEMLWSDVEPDNTRAALRQTLFQLRRVLDEGSIAGADELTLECPLNTDRDDFLAALESGNLERAIALYRGPFLPSFGVPGGAGFEQWADLERHRLQSGFMRGAELLIRRQLNRSQFKDARQLARQVRDVLPHVEAAGRLLLEASVASNDFVTAAMEASVLEQWAVAEDVVLEPSTKAAIARARRLAPGASIGEAQFALVAELTGREQEFFAITTAWDRVRKGPSQRLHVNAPAGFGKTRLLRDAMARLSASGASIVHVRGAPGDRDVPYAFVGDLAAVVAALPGARGISPASASTLVALNPTLSTHFAREADVASGEESMRRRILALAELMHAASDEQRFVLVIDDLHWIDASSLRVLDGLWSRLGTAHILVITAARPERAPSADGCTILSLHALELSQVGALVSTIGVIPTDEAWGGQFISGLHAATSGSPLLVLETLRVALDQRVLALADGEWDCLDAPQLTALLQAGEALRARVRGLPSSQLAILMFLAIAGTPFASDDIAAALTIAPDDLRQRTSALEQQGLITLANGAWTPVHDELADAALAGVSAPEHAAIEMQLGQFFARSARVDHNSRVRAVKHFQNVGAAASVNEIFRRHALSSRHHGDRRSFRNLAAELTGNDEASAQVSTLVGTLPRTWRIGLWSRVRQFAAAVAAVLLPVLATGFVQYRNASDALLQRIYFADSAKRVTSIALRRGDFAGSNEPLLRKAAQSPSREAAAGYPELPPAFSPDGRSVAWTQNMGDSTILDIWLRTPAGVRRLTNRTRDDLVSEWLPDGSAILGTTSRWSAINNADYDVAIFDTATGAARQITHGHAHDTQPHASPDGTRIAFIRATDELPNQLCVTPIDAQTEPECRLIGGQAAGFVLGWSSLSEIILQTATAGGSQIVAHDWLRNAQRSIFGSRPQWARLSPDRKWVVAALRVSGFEEFRDWIAPIDNPGQARPVDAGSGLVGSVRWWEGTADRSLLIDHIAFTDSARTAPLGFGTQLRVKAVSTAGIDIPLMVATHWSSSDSTIAAVDSQGVVVPRRPGDVTITASLAGWRAVSKPLHVSGKSASVVFSETWSDDWQRRWISWGEPQPEIVTGPAAVRALFNNGDGTYISFALARRGYSARDGLGAEVKISTPVTSPRAQRLATELVAGVDTSELLAAHQGGNPPQSTYQNTIESCGMNFPLDGNWAETRMAFRGNVVDDIDLKEFARPLRTGAWWTLRLQIFPDGRCGVAVNGRVVWISPDPIRLTGEFRLKLGDTSVGTQLLHGPLQIWTGVKRDIDWTHVTR